MLLLAALISCSIQPEPAYRFADEPALVQDFEFEDNTSGWGWHPDWARATWTQNHTQMTVDRAAVEDGFLHIRTTDYLQADPAYAGDLTALGGSIQTKNHYRYGKWEARLKPSSESGVVNAFFIWSDANGQEVDFEFLPYTFGAGIGQVHLAVHKNGFSNHFVREIDLGFNPSDDFHNYSLEIYRDKVVWLADDIVLAEYVYDDEVSIDSEYLALINGWSWTHDWVKGPPAQTAHYYVDWVRFYPLIEK